MPKLQDSYDYFNWGFKIGANIALSRLYKYCKKYSGICGFYNCNKDRLFFKEKSTSDSWEKAIVDVKEKDEHQKNKWFLHILQRDLYSGCRAQRLL